ncbi:MAG: hypothetical protein ACE5R6_21090 [Candidatus Heimdallarchaeota archaeon]
MTHTHHRRGDKTSLEGDYVLLAMTARGFNDQGTAPKLKRILEIFAKYNPVNMGNMTAEQSLCMARGACIEEIIRKTSSKGIIHAVYASKESAQYALKEIKEADLGISIVTTGIFEEVFHMADELGIKQPRTVNLSLDILGNTKRLPSEPVLEILTMCGHSLVSKQLIEQQLKRLRARKTTVQQAAAELAKQCVCGIFNPVRAEHLLEKNM